MKIELFLDEDVHSGLAHALRKRGYDAIQRNDVKIIKPASAHHQRNNEEPFGVLVDSLNYSTYLTTKPKKQTKKTI